MYSGPALVRFQMKEIFMSETMSPAKAHEVKEKKEKVKERKVKAKDEDPISYCCTPGGGGGGPDTRP